MTAPHRRCLSFSALCEALGKPYGYVRGLQSALALHIPEKGGGYSRPYLNFLLKVIALRTFSVPLDEIGALFQKEKKIIELLHIDSLHPSPTWYLDAADSTPHTPRRLLLTGHDVGFPLATGAIQSHLDFQRRPAELFARAEMGEDVSRVIRQYLKLLDQLKARIHIEQTVLLNALDWADDVFGRAPDRS